jgi:hypothetical protein
MKKNMLLLFGNLLVMSAVSQYSPEFVTCYKGIVGNQDLLSFVMMSAEGRRIKAKRFSGIMDGRSVYNRYREWIKDKTVISAVETGYISDYQGIRPTPVGICVDEGVVVGRTVAEMDALVIVSSDGHVSVHDMRENITVRDFSGESHTFDLRSGLGRSGFFMWAAKNRISAFQSHLLGHKGINRVSPVNSSELKRSRRLFAILTDEEGSLHYYIVNIRSYNTLYKATDLVMTYFKEIDMDVSSIINLETGYNDIFLVKGPDGNDVNDRDFKGEGSMDSMQGILVFYFE